jgi:hypothetical protein
MAYDADIAKVSLLLHCDGTNGSGTFLDSGPLGLVPTNNGVTVSTTQSKFGGASASFNGTSSFLSYASNTAFDFPGDFLIEAQVYMTSTPSSAQVVMRQGGNTALQCRLTSGVPELVTLASPHGATTASASSAISLNTWHQIAWERQGTTLRVYVDNAVVGTATEPSLNDLTNTSSRPLYVGAYNDGGSTNSFFPGYLDEIRITKGLARYAGTSTAQSAAFPDVAADTSAHRYWRVFVKAVAGGTSDVPVLSEVHFCTTVGGSTVTTGGTAIESSHDAFGEVAANAFDGVLTTNWAPATSTMPQWVGYDFGSGNNKLIVQFSVRNRDNGGTPANQSPTEFQLQYSDDSTTWTPVYAASGQTGWATGETRTFTVVTASAARPVVFVCT